MTEGGEDKRTYTAVVAAEIGVVVVVFRVPVHLLYK